MFTNFLLLVIIVLLFKGELRANNTYEAPLLQGDTIIAGLQNILGLLNAPYSKEEEGYLYKILIEIRALHTLLEERVPRKF